MNRNYFKYRYIPRRPHAPRSPAHRHDVSVAADAAAAGRRRAFVRLALLLLLRGLVAFVGAEVTVAGVRGLGHEVDELLQRRAELPLLAVLQAVVQRLVDHESQ